MAAPDDGEGAGTSAASEEEERLLEAQVGKIAAEEAADVVWWRSKQVQQFLASSLVLYICR